MRKGIIKLIDWDRLGFEIAYEAGNGQEALDILKSEKVDVIITDIKMPVMDGIELIKRVSEKFENKPAIIIISGYNEFEFAKAAIKYGVNDYLLKPIDENELIQTLEKIKTRILSEKEEYKKKELFEYVRRNSAFIKALELQNNDYLVSSSKDGVKKYLGISKQEAFQYEDDLTIYEKLMETEKSVNTKYSDKCIEIKCYWDSYFNLLFVVNTIQGYTKNSLIKQVFDEIRDILNLQAIIVQEYVSNQKIHVLYKQLLRKFNFVQFYEKSGIIEASEIGEFEHYLEDKKLSKELIRLIEEKRFEDINIKISKFFDECHTNKVSPEVIKGYILLAVLEIIDYFEAYQMLETDSIKLIFRSNIQRSKFLDGIIGILNQIINYIDEDSKFNGSSFMKKIELFIKENYNKDITIKSIAQQFYINPIYLGRMFKKHFNMPFNKYLHLVRIENAKRLLLKTDMKIYEIAKEVGYSDPDYFALKFEEYVGKSPSKFRNSVSANDG
ncbi:two component transcriptional regulator, AraC family [Caldicellulosiruptor owensensis OL]|uniref:Two component transcriptional regulator, AraC family n=1 Tax=Caldicellulosiruptor owensensis (strain ATCC 700167 / DSM 13100 / OL) TaxID=632518 RepID=E4Q5I0_CALOW|nr:two component transcriptional regulator, AraC family [Caldicellulosiruptor owensensis OL]